jgi:hypothetical protein
MNFPFRECKVRAAGILICAARIPERGFDHLAAEKRGASSGSRAAIMRFVRSE